MAIKKEELSNIVTSELSKSEAWMDSDLAGEIEKNIEYYYGEKFGNEKKGFSQVVTRDVFMLVEGVMTQLMKIFTSGDQVVRFDPVDSEDNEAADQATEYINYIFNRRSNGYEVMYDWFKEALIAKNSVVKVSWQEKEEVCFDFFKDLTQEQVDIKETQLGEGEKIEEKTVNEGEEISDEEIENLLLSQGLDLNTIPEEELENLKETLKTQVEEASKTFDIKISRRTKKGKPLIEVLPMEEFRISSRAKCIEDAQFVAHVVNKTVGELIEDGFKEEDIMAAGSSFSESEMEQVSDARYESGQDEEESTSIERSYEKLVRVVDSYVHLFDEEDEIVKIYHSIQVGHKILFMEEVGEVPFVAIAPIRMPHRFTGISIAELALDIQEIRSKLFREALNNASLVNAGRYQIVEGQVNVKDLIDNKIGGIVRSKSQDAVRTLDTPQLSQGTFAMIGQLEEERDMRSGVSKMTQGLDSNALTSNTAATSVNMVMTAAQEKILLVARNFAETGVKKLMWLLYRIIRQNQSQEDIVKLRGKFVAVRPFDWKDRTDMTVTVGLGNGNKDQQLYHLNNIANILDRVKNSPYGYLISADNVYNLTTEMIKNGGYKDIDSFISNPANVQPPQSQPSPEDLKDLAEAEKDKADAALKLSEVELNKIEAQNNQLKLQKELEELKLKREEFEWKKKVDVLEAGIEIDQKRPVGLDNK